MRPSTATVTDQRNSVGSSAFTPSLTIREVAVKNVLTRATGYLRPVASHSLQPYRGCTFGRSLCGVGCYVQHNRFVTGGAAWGTFLEVKTNAAESYERQYPTEHAWARRARGEMAVFLSSATDPFVPQEDRFRISRGLLEAMLDRPPDLLIVQTHSHRVTSYVDLYQKLTSVCRLRFHISIESDVDRLPGLPPPASSVERRFAAASALTQAGFRVVITVSPLLPIREPERFFERIRASAGAVVIDHFIEGDGTPNGVRTLKTMLPDAMRAVRSDSVSLRYRDAMVEVARRILPGRVGVGADGFAGRYLPA